MFGRIAFVLLKAIFKIHLNNLAGLREVGQREEAGTASNSNTKTIDLCTKNAPVGDCPRQKIRKHKGLARTTYFLIEAVCVLLY